MSGNETQSTSESTAHSGDTNAMTVTEITYAIKQSLEGGFSHVTVHGEISNFKCQSSGHWYFSIKDTHSQLNCVCFRGSNSKLGFMPRDGQKVSVKGQITVYAPRGNYQLLCYEVRPVGVGDILAHLHQLKIKLKEEGLFLPEHKKQLPFMPKRIGVITSPTGAVIQDIVHVLKRRFQGFQLMLFPCRVQGSEAANEISNALRLFNKNNCCDVIIVARGGGSLEDLMPFNNETVIRAIFESDIPVISAVGHETDYTLCDLVADKRAPTPSAAAEIAVPDQSTHAQQLKMIGQHLYRSLIKITQTQKQRLLEYAKHPFITNYKISFMRWAQQLDMNIERIQQSKIDLSHQYTMLNRFFEISVTGITRRLSETKASLSSLGRDIKQKITQQHDKTAMNHRIQESRLKNLSMIDYIKNKAKHLTSLRSALYSSNPYQPLERGYALIKDEGNNPLTSVVQLSPGKSFTAMLKDGYVHSTVVKTSESKLT